MGYNFSISDPTKSAVTAVAGGSIATLTPQSLVGNISSDGINLGFSLGQSQGTVLFSMTEGNVAVVNNPGDGVAASMTITDPNGQSLSNQGGLVSDLTGGLVQPTSGLLGVGSSGPILVDKFDMQAGVNFQLQYGIGGAMFLQAFGDKATSVLVQGMALNSDCANISAKVGPASLSINAGVPGLTQFLSFYYANKMHSITAGADLGKLPQVLISWFDGTTKFRGYIISATVGIQRADNFAVSFSMQLIGQLDRPSRGLLGDLEDLGLNEIGTSVPAISNTVTSLLP